MGQSFIKVSGVWKQIVGVSHKVSGAWKDVNSMFHKVAGVQKNVFDAEIIKTISANAVDLILIDLFTPTEWNSSAKKRVIINAGVTISGSTSTFAAVIQSSSYTTGWGGTLTLENHGTIGGRGGAANSGVGGNALYPGAYAYTAKKLLVENYGTIYGGGGGGGRGGTGGAGYYLYTATEGPYYARSGTEYYWSAPGGSGNSNVVWADTAVTISADKDATSYPSGAYTYYRGTFQSASGSPTRNYYQIYRQYTATAYTSGGGGGNGGRGRGTDGANAGGSVGAAGGTNAGTGGTGGTGGAYGATGNTGATGASGNYSGGVGGNAGGAAGYAYANASTTILIPGTILGRVA